jgi:hypothetical protein
MVQDIIYKGFRFKLKESVLAMYRKKQIVEYISVPSEFRNSNITYFLERYLERHYNIKSKTK